MTYVRTSALPFDPHAQFKKADLDERHALYRMLAERVWNPNRLEDALTKS